MQYRTSERKRRQVYRSEVHGQLPFVARGMDEPTPSLEISTSGSADSVFSLGRHDVHGLFELLSYRFRMVEKLT